MPFLYIDDDVLGCTTIFFSVSEMLELTCQTQAGVLLLIEETSMHSIISF